MREDPLPLPYTYTPSSSIVGLLLHLQYYQRCEPIILKMWVKSKFVLWQPRFYNLLPVKRITKLTFLKYSFFWKRTVTVNPEAATRGVQNSQENTCARDSGLGQRLRPATLLKKSLWHRCFPVNFAKFVRTPFL